MKNPLNCTIHIVLFATTAISSNLFGVNTAPDAVISDWKSMLSIHQQVDQKLKNVVPSHDAQIIGNDYDKILKTLHEFEQELPTINQKLKAFENKYGKDASTINDLLWELTESVENQRPDKNAGHAYSEIKKYISNVPPARLNESNSLLQEAKSLKNSIDSLDSWATTEKYDELRLILQNALKFDPENTEANEMLNALNEDQQDRKDSIKEKIASKKWPKPFKAFKGPGRRSKLEDAVLEYLHEDEIKRQTKDHTFAVVVTGNWVVAKKNLLGEPIQWGLPVLAACYTPEEKKNGTCRAFELTLITHEGVNQTKEPPFIGAWVGNKDEMFIKNVKRVASIKSTTAGIDGFVINTIFSLVTILAGALGAESIIRAKRPTLEPLFEKLQNHAKHVGIFAVVLSLFCLARAVVVLNCSFLSDLLPVVSAILIGLVLAKSVFPIKGPLLSVLENNKPQLGLAALVLGSIHLILGRLPLF